jgi:hypothetical protein
LFSQGGDDDGFSDDDSDAVAARKGKQAFVSSLEEEHSDDEDVGTAGKEKEGYECFSELNKQLNSATAILPCARDA